MFKYFLKRLAQMVVTLFIVSILVFVLANFIGDPVNMLVSPKAPPEVREQVREELGLNRPILEQYVSFITNAFKGDFGKSYIYKVDALSLIAQRVPATLELVFVSAVLALGISIPLGVYAGAFPKRKSSTLVMGGSILGISLPSFFMSGWGDGSGEGMVIFNDMLYTYDGKAGMGEGNRGHYSNAEVDALLDQASVEADQAKRAALVEQVDQIARDEAAYIPLFFKENIFGVRAGIQYTPSADDHILAWDFTF